MSILSFFCSAIAEARSTQRAEIHEWTVLLGVTGARLEITMKIVDCSRPGPKVNRWFCEGHRVWKAHKVLSSLFFSSVLGTEKQFCLY